MSQLAIITGAGSGIGQALAIELAATHNIRALAVGRRLQPLQETQIHYPERILPVAADISREEDRRRILESIPPGSQVQFLVHNAAQIEPLKPLSEVTSDEWRQHFAVNLEAPLFLSKMLLERLRDGRILHISSGLAHYPLAGSGAYCISKAALFMMYQVLNLELKERNISVGSLRPGIVDTPMQEVIRMQRPQDFPDVKRFTGYKEENKLLQPATVARFIAQVLIKTGREEFSAKEWDVRDDAERFSVA